MLRRTLSRILTIGLASAFAVMQTAGAAVAAGEAAPRIRALAGVFEQIAGHLPSTRFDLAAAMAEGGVDTPEKVATWIARETHLVPYAGRLRGAEGVLADRSGNALDRALLAAAMLQKLGVNVRLASATLSDADAATLLGAVAAPVFAAADVSVVPADPTPFVAAGIPAAEVDAAIAAQAEASAALRAERQIRLGTQPAWLAGLAGAGPADLAASERAAALAALKAHWWAQAEIDGAWVDLDPAAALLGHALAAEATLAPDALPADLSHTMTFRIVAEAVQDGAASEVTLLEKTFAAADIAAAPVTLGFEGGGAATTMGDGGAALLAAAVAAPGWLPRLTVAGEQLATSGITTGGEVKPADDPLFASDKNVGAAVAGGVAGAADLLGGAGEEPAATGLLTAMWLEVESGAPGQPIVKERRAVFDLVGASARAEKRYPGELTTDQIQSRSASLMGVTDIVVQTAAMPADQAAFLMASGLRDSLQLVAAALDADGRQWSVPDDAQSRRVPIPLYVYAAGRFTGAEGVYIDRPNAAAVHTRQMLVDGELTQQSVFDVLVNSVGVVADDPFAARLAQGVRDTVAEDQAFAFPAASGNASARYADYAGAGIAFGPLAPASLPPDEAALAQAQIDAGYLVIAPATALGSEGAAVWWRVDPRTGATLGFGPGGYGSTSAEQVSILVNIGLRMIGVLVCIDRLASAQASGNTCGMVAGGLCLAGAVISTVGVAAKALGEIGAVASNWVSSAGIAGGLLGGAAGSYCR